MAGRYFRRARRAAPDSQGRSSQGRQRALRCEPLEDRRLLAVLTVDTELDVVDFNDGLMSLREAVFVANTVEGVDEIRFDLGHDEPATMLLTGGEFAITDGLTIVGPGSEAFTIDAQHNSRVFNVSGEGAFLELSGVMLLNGQTTGDNLNTSEIVEQRYGGGAIRAAGASLRIDDVVILASSVTGANASGGAIFASGTLIVTNSRFSSNGAQGRNGTGGAIAATGSASVTATTVSSNVASRGGGVSISSTGQLDVDRSTFNDNLASDSYAALGGGIYSLGWTSVMSSTISGNAAQVTGFDGVAQGGGVWVSVPWEIAFSTITANSASSPGLGSVATGGGIYANVKPMSELQDWVLLDHTIVAGNVATEGSGDLLRNGAVYLAINHSLIGDNDGSLLHEVPVGSPDGEGNLIGGTTYGLIDPLLGALADNGGPTWTHALLPGSPAIFAGSLERSAGNKPSGWHYLPNTPEFDQRGEGYSRRAGTRIDIGAVEYSGRTLIVDSLGDEVDGDYGPRNFTLREALAVANENPDYDVIEFSPSIYSSRPTTIYLKNGELPILNETTIYGRGAERLVIQGSGQPARVVRATADALLQGVTITGGDARGEGGGISSSQHLTLIDVTVKGNRSIFTGGGVWAAGLTMVASRVEDNDSQTGGGGVHVTGGLVMTLSVVSGNQSLDSREGVGGVYATARRDQPTPASVSISSSTIVGNTGGRVGGIATNVRHFEMHHTLVADNSGSGGGVEALNALSLHISNSSIVENSGFGLSITTLLDEAVVEDSTISGNRTQRMAGGIYVTGKATLRRVTVTDNSAEGIGAAGDGGGIVVVGQLTLESSIVAGNHAPLSPDIWQRTNSTIDAKYNVIGDNRGTMLAEVGPDQSSTNRIGGPVRGVLSPGLGPLMNNGGWLPTHLPLPGSVAIDMGAPSDETTSEFDQRGMPYERVVGRRMDSGAVEAQRTWNGGSATGDFNQDGKVDGADFLAWQRGYGKTDATVSDGDGTADGNVDGNDLALWKMRVSSWRPQIEAGAASVALTEVEVTGIEEAVAGVVIADEFAATPALATATTERHWSVPLTPEVEGFDGHSKAAAAEEMLAVKHAAFAAVDSARRDAVEFSWRAIPRQDVEFLDNVSEVDGAFNAEITPSLEWGLIGR